ncbi:MAG: hypothetical protein WAK48_10120, partial [Candidatus Acidiferrum sp.]
GCELKRKPAFAGGFGAGAEARIGLGAISQGGRHGIELEDDGRGRVKAACKGKSGKNGSAPIEKSETKHAFGRDGWPGA